MAQAAEEYGSHDKTFEIAAAGHRARRRRRRRRRCSSTRSPTGDIWRMCQTKDAAIQDWVRLAVARARATGHAGGVLARRDPRRTTPSCCARSARRSTQLDTEGLEIEILDVADGDAVHARARPRRRGHDLGHRQRAARLPHRPVPDPRARHEREDAVDRAADERRRPVRDRRRRLGAQARAAVPRGEPPALGLARRVPRARSRRSSCSPSRTGNPRAKLLARHARPRDRPRARGGPLAVARGRRARQPRQPLLPGAVLGPGAGRAGPRTPSWPSASRRWPSGSPTNEEQIVAELAAVQGSPVDIGGYYRPDPEQVAAAMRPSATLNEALERFAAA